MRPRQETLTAWPPAVMMQPAEHDPMGRVYRALDRVEQRLDDLLELLDEPPDTEPDPRVWPAG